MSRALDAETLEPQDARFSPSSESPVVEDAWYMAQLRQLPTKYITDGLVSNFFKTVNWQYNPLDKTTFTADRAQWDAVSYAQLLKGVHLLPPESRFFPAVLLQVLALSLLHWETSDDRCDSLRYKDDMALDDVAREYSEAGATLMATLARSELPRPGIQAMFLRTMFLKTTGKVVKSWNLLGDAISAARRLRWHLDLPCEGTQQPHSRQCLWDFETQRTTYAYILLRDCRC